MRERLNRFSLASAVVVAVMFCPKAWSQQTNQQPLREQAGQRVAGTQDQARTPAEGETIRGVVAAITAEGEVMLDHRTNTAARSEAAFLTIVGSSSQAWAGDTGNRAATERGTDRAGTASSNKKRHNVYIAWLTSRTKVCEANDESGGRTDTNRAANAGAAGSSDKKECMLDQVEVGDHVEIKFSPGESTGANANGAMHQSQQMRSKHGRHRTFVGYATEVTILPSKDHERAEGKTPAPAGSLRERSN
jgi:hypothetical protein